MSLKFIYLSYCPHSLRAKSTLENFKIKHDPLKADDKRDHVSKNFDKINNGYKTYPQIYWENENNIHFLGGNDRLQEIFTEFKNINIPTKPKDWKSDKEWMNFLVYLANNIKK